jgi:hypothetical protein
MIDGLIEKLFFLNEEWDLLSLRYFEALPKMNEGKGSTIFLPSEAAGVLGAVGGIREMLRGTMTPPAGDMPRGGRPAPTPSLGYASPRPPALSGSSDPSEPPER